MTALIGQNNSGLWSRRCCSTPRTSRSRSSTGRRRSRFGARGRSRLFLCTTAKSGRSPSVSSCRRSSGCCATSRSSGNIDYVPFSRANIYARDDHSCQYCGEVFPTAELTFDHVVPVAQGGRKDWENIVTCCITCNRRKGGRTPAEAGMHLIRVPKRPDKAPAIRITVGLQERAGQLARLLLLEHGARRDLTHARAALAGSVTAASRRIHDDTFQLVAHFRGPSALGRGRRARHHRGRRASSSIPSLPQRAHRRRAGAAGDAPRRATLTAIVPAGLDGGHTPVRIDERAGETALRRDRRAAGDRPAPGRQPGLRRRRATST